MTNICHVAFCASTEVKLWSVTGLDKVLLVQLFSCIQRIIWVKTNPFWNDTFQAYEDFYGKIEAQTPKEILIEPTFHNKFKSGGEVFNDNDWTEKNVYAVKDLVNDDGQY